MDPVFATSRFICMKAGSRRHPARMVRSHLRASVSLHPRGTARPRSENLNYVRLTRFDSATYLCKPDQCYMNGTTQLIIVDIKVRIACLADLYASSVLVCLLTSFQRTDAVKEGLEKGSCLNYQWQAVPPSAQEV